jgi:hypothetical protein
MFAVRLGCGARRRQITRPMPPGYRPPVPERFGALTPSQGIMFTCRGCTRAMALPRADLVKRWGEEGRVADVAARFRCANCKRRGAAVAIARMRDERTDGERARAELAPIDRLVHDIAALKTLGQVD